jgi:cell division protein ZapE
MAIVNDMYQQRLADGSLRPDTAQAAIIPAFERIADALAQPQRRGFFRRAPEPPKGLYLWGGVGRGKSMMMDLFVDAVAEFPVRRVHFHAFMQDIHAEMHKARANGAKDALAPVAEKVATGVRVLALDEMQITDITDAMIVGRLFEALFAAGVIVVTTSNRVPDDLYKNGLNRQLFVPFIDQIKQQMQVVEIVSPLDYRQDRLQGGQVYFHPISAETRATMQSIWIDLTGGPAAPLDLYVMGRNVTLPAFRNGIARATFFDLCGQPLGPADYLAIAQSVKVLMIEDIPSLGRDNFNQAKRFVTLIDALYEADVRLIASAADRPDMLYVEGAGSFEFERTASRLMEMQSADWGL